MIVILSPTAQLASDTLEYDPPPSLTVEAEYGAFVLEGTKYTAAHHQPIGSPYVGRHISPFGRPAPCNDDSIPKLDENEVALEKEAQEKQIQENTPPWAQVCPTRSELLCEYTKFSCGIR